MTIPDSIELIAGIALVIYCAYERYCAPSNLLKQVVFSENSARHIQSARASTTASRFFASASSYCLAYVCLFLILLFFFPGAAEQSEDKVEAIVGIDDLPAEITLAVLLSVLIPKLPFFSSIDAKFIGFLHRTAAIPLEAVHLGGRLQKSEFSVAEGELKRQIDSDLLEMGVSEDIVDSDHHLINKWVEVSALIHQIRSWERDKRFSGFVFENRPHYEQLIGEHDRADKLARKVISLRQYAGKAAPPILGDHDQTSGELSRIDTEANGLPVHLRDMLETARRFEENLDETLDHIRSGLCDFIAHAVLRVFVSIQKRDDYIISMGFTDTSEPSPKLRLINQMIGLLISLILLLLIITVCMFSRTEGWSEILLRITMIAAIYVVSIGWVLFPKGFGGVFAYHDGHGLPFLGYLISAIGAVLSSGLISTGYRALLMGSKGEETPLLRAWEITSTQAYPWLLMGFVSTLYLCLMCDIQFRIPLSKLAIRFLIALGLVITLALAGYLVIEWLGQINSHHGKEFLQIPPYRNVVSYSSIVGALLGFLVPSWHRLQYVPTPRVNLSAESHG